MNAEMTVAITMAAIALAMVPVALIVMWRMQKRLLERIQRQFDYDDLECAHVDVLDLPKATRQHFDTLTDRMTALGFRRIGDHRVRSQPLTYVRRFISDDRRTFGELVDARMLPLWHLRTYDFISVLGDGTYLETGRVRQPQQDRRVLERFHLVGLPGASLEELHRQHLEEVERLARSRGSRPREFQPEEIRQVANYGHQLVAWDRRFQAGRQTDPPELALPPEREAPVPVAAGEVG